MSYLRRLIQQARPTTPSAGATGHGPAEAPVQSDALMRGVEHDHEEERTPGSARERAHDAGHASGDPPRGRGLGGHPDHDAFQGSEGLGADVETIDVSVPGRSASATAASRGPAPAPRASHSAPGEAADAREPDARPAGSSRAESPDEATIPGHEEAYRRALAWVRGGPTGEVHAAADAAMAKLARGHGMEGLDQEDLDPATANSGGRRSGGPQSGGGGHDARPSDEALSRSSRRSDELDGTTVRGRTLREGLAGGAGPDTRLRSAEARTGDAGPQQRDDAVTEVSIGAIHVTVETPPSRPTPAPPRQDPRASGQRPLSSQPAAADARLVRSFLRR